LFKPTSFSTRHFRQKHRVYGEALTRIVKNGRKTFASQPKFSLSIAFIRSITQTLIRIRFRKREITISSAPELARKEID
jgi:hypothetical protein